MSEQQVTGRVSGCYLDVGESGVSVGEVDPARDAVEVGLGDDVHELVDAPRGVDVLDVGLVLAMDKAIFGIGNDIKYHINEYDNSFISPP